MVIVFEVDVCENMGICDLSFWMFIEHISWKLYICVVKKIYYLSKKFTKYDKSFTVCDKNSMLLERDILRNVSFKVDML